MGRLGRMGSLVKERTSWSAIGSTEEQTLIYKACAHLSRQKDVLEILKFVLDETRTTLYIYGRPGSGKTHTAKAIGEVLVEQGLEVYYSNLVIDPEFEALSSGPKTTTILLIADEFEGKKASRLYIRQKDKLEKKIEKERSLSMKSSKTNKTVKTVVPKEKSALVFKTIFISNRKSQDGLLFTPYTKEEIKAILDQDKSMSAIEKIIRLREGVERADIRVSLGRHMVLPTNGSKGCDGQVFGHYHQFIQQRVEEGVVCINTLYAEFLTAMKQKGISVIPKELFQDILETYLDGSR
ncbi:hypothetical protein NEHOM01_0163 [Nematocida homosporus]|uniref:uncharacterized protein n=1 Tax=Nematocida homosporus TaxID=1912981 RepID=UPI00221F2555|nr:uncharacterized protein NEHOM01_0163 [Nematocida homosporus]KAI5184418.1 hypothetical protein NEHOM01_0163 [Nematocida homosporus]